MAEGFGEKQFQASLKAKFGGLGGPETTRDEFIKNVKADTYGSLAMHGPLTEHLSVALGKPTGVVRTELVEKIARARRG